MSSIDKKTIAIDAREGASAAAEILTAAENMLATMAELVAAQREYSRAMTMLAEQIESDDETKAA